jgi:hypothetical protein
MKKKEEERKGKKKGARFGPGLRLAERTTWAILLRELVTLTTSQNDPRQLQRMLLLAYYLYILSGMSILTSVVPKTLLIPCYLQDHHRLFDMCGSFVTINLSGFNSLKTGIFYIIFHYFPAHSELLLMSGAILP